MTSLPESGPDIIYNNSSLKEEGKIENKIILIIGGTGSLGHELIKWFTKKNKIVIFSRDENKQWALKIKYPGIDFVIGDIRDQESISRVLKMVNPHIVIIASALKHIDICEVNVWQAVLTNIIGIHAVVESVFSIQPSNLSNVLFISTDKACLSISTYGSTKYLGEKIMIEAGYNALKIGYPVVFSSVRYGNVVNSRGSLLPKYAEIASNKEETHFPVTDTRMTRFFMLLSQAVNLIEVSILNGKSGEIWIPVVNSFRILEIAQHYAKQSGKETKITGIRGCEKIHEILLSPTETEKTSVKSINNSTFYVVHPFYDNSNIETRPDGSYTSENVSSVEEFIRKYISIV